MAFKLIVFIAILAAIAVLGVRAYSASVRRFEAAQALPGPHPAEEPGAA